MSKTVIQVENISKMYNLGSIGAGSIRETISNGMQRLRGQNIGDTEEKEFWALRDINFEVKEGEVVGIIGKNGAGKSTLLKVLSRITQPTTGQIKLGGRIASLLEVGTGFHPELTGRENIFLNGSILGMGREEIKRKFDEIVAFSGVEKFLDTPVKRYSSGMYVRLAFAVAAHLEPEILVIDEVLAVGDAEFQNRCLGKMQDVAQSGRTVLFVSHNMAAVRKLCKRGIFLQKGQISMDGLADPVVERYLNEGVKRGQLDLQTRSDRRGNGWVKFSRIQFVHPETFKPVDQLMSGYPALLEIEYEASPNFDYEVIQDLHIGLAVYNQYEQFVTALNNKMSNFHFSNLPKKGKLRCRFEKIPFMFGNFRALASLSINGILSDQIEDAVYFHVAEGDFYRSGLPNSQNRSGIYIDQTWSTGS